MHINKKIITLIIVFLGILSMTVSVQSTAFAKQKDKKKTTVVNKKDNKTAAKSDKVKKETKGKVAEKDKSKEKDLFLDLSNKIGDSLRKGKPVVVFVYSKIISVSKDQIPDIKEIAKKSGADFYDIIVEDYIELRYGYDINYVPTILVFRPDAGLYGMWEVDFSNKEIENALTKNISPNSKQKQISDAIKEKKPVLLFFMAKFCGYCRALSPEIKRFQQDYSKCVDVVTIDVEDYPQLQDPYLVSGVPVLFLVDKDGLARIRTGYPSGYEKYRDGFSLLDPETKACISSAKKSGEKS